MIKNKRKGFTLTEMIIVIAVIIILAAILIPTFISLIRKSNMNSDLVLAKNLNIAVQEYKEENGIDDITEFEDAIVAVKLGGYVISTLNAKTKNCYFVWDNKNDQFILVEELDELVDGKNYQPLYYEIDNINDIPLPSLSDPNNKNTIDYFEDGELKIENKGYWYFATTGFDKINHIIDHFGKKINYRLIVDSISDMGSALLTDSSGKQTIYVDGDQGLMFDKNDGSLVVGGAGKNPDITLDLMNAELESKNSTGHDKAPIVVQSGNLTIKNGTIYGDGAGSVGATNVIELRGNSSLTLENITLEAETGSGNGAILGYSGGKTYIYKSTINTPSAGLYLTSGHVTILEDCVINADVLCNLTFDSTLVINSGTYNLKSAICNMWVSKQAGKQLEEVAIINGGEFTSSSGLFTTFRNASMQNIFRVYIITGGTFNGKPFNEITETEWKGKYSYIAGARVSGAALHNPTHCAMFDENNNLVSESERIENPSKVDKIVIAYMMENFTYKGVTYPELEDYFEKYKDYIK